MTDLVVTAGGTAPPSRRPWRGVNRVFRRRQRLAVSALIGPAVGWLLVVYIVSLALLVVSAFFRLDGFTGEPTSELTIDNVKRAFTTRSFLDVVVRSVVIAASVTAVCLVIALPAAFFIAKVARPWARRSLIIAVLMPLWAGYLVKGYAWKAMLRPASEFGVDKSGGVLDAVFGYTPGFGYVAVVLALTYLWLPYMVIPIYAGLERLPQTVLEASGDLGARPWRTFAGVVVPMLIPSIAAGSIFTFSLSLGDYIMPRLVTEGGVTMVGNIIYSTLLAPNQPLAAAYTLWPLLIIIGYLIAMRRVGAFDSL
ncbi:MAG TPA: ABC transporter permease [Desertimonas sp.]|nr:ABC transporter permease [Desertimonas sp.]